MASTNKVDIEYGQSSTLDQSEALESAQGPYRNSGSFEVNNKYGPISVGIMGKLNGRFEAISVSSRAGVGKVELKPTPANVAVWFDSESSTSQMIGGVPYEQSFEYSFNGHNGTVKYAGSPGNGQWSHA